MAVRIIKAIIIVGVTAQFLCSFVFTKSKQVHPETRVVVRTKLAKIERRCQRQIRNTRVVRTTHTKDACTWHWARNGETLIVSVSFFDSITDAEACYRRTEMAVSNGRVCPVDDWGDAAFVTGHSTDGPGTIFIRKAHATVHINALAKQSAGEFVDVILDIL